MSTIKLTGVAFLFGLIILGIQKIIPPILPAPADEKVVTTISSPPQVAVEHKKKMPICGTALAQEDKPCLTLNGFEALALMALLASRELPRP